MNDQSSMTKEQIKIDRRKRKIAQIRYSAFMLWHACYWRLLHFTKLARPYSVMMCKFNFYRKFPDGRCQWCGINHAENKPNNLRKGE